MSSPSSSLCSPGGDCPLQQLKELQWRTTSNKQHLADLSPILATNYPLHPESSNYLLARWGSHNSHADLRQLDRIVRDLQNILDDAKETRNHVLESASQFDTLFHPIRSLPDDILLLIFEWCTFSHIFSVFDYGSLANEYPPWRISTVCRCWRDLVLTSPRLWSVVRLPTFLLTDIPCEDIVSKLHVQLKRSGNALLDVTIGNNKFPTSHLLDHKGELVSLLRPSTDRWRSLHVYADGCGSDVAFLGCPFPALTCLEIKDCPEYNLDTDVVFTAFRHTPSLVRLDACSTKLDVNWDNIISLKTYSKSLATHLLLPSLQELTLLQPFMDNYEPPTKMLSLTLPKLRTLFLHFHLDTKLIDYISMPSLETLQMVLSFSSEPVYYPDLRRCSQRLRSLCLILKGNPTDVQPLLSFLAEAPHVTSLYLRNQYGTLLNTTALRMDGTNDLFPHLETLTLVPSMLEYGAYAEVRAVIESRLNLPIPKIRELRLIGSKRYRVWEVTFAEIRRLGVKVSYVGEWEF